MDIQVRLKRIAGRLVWIQKESGLGYYAHCPGLSPQTVCIIQQSHKRREKPWYVAYYIHPTTRKPEKLHVSSKSRQPDMELMGQLIATQLFIGGFYDELSKVWQ